ncbi:uncharacterized protein LOC135840413 [Planococcus citri]|uniref:uncharacterized protein LOC135840413 n=1 Tax=Planococcus citri TaxID=170843 RepID=UPI0031F7F66A
MFLKYEVPYTTNMVGFAADGANVMFGAHNSVATMFKRDVPAIVNMKCICHSLALEVRYAVKKLPSNLESMLSDVYCYLKHSTKRQQHLAGIQKILDLPEHKILKFKKVRWLSLQGVVERYVEQYDALLQFFETERTRSSNNAEAVSIHVRLQNRWFRLYLHFLNFVLPVVINLNREFQSEQPKIFSIHRKMQAMFRVIVQWYLKEEYVQRTDIDLIEFRTITDDNKHNWENLRNIELGPVVESCLKSLPTNTDHDDILKFRGVCRDFMIELASQIYQRFPFNESEVQLLEEISYLEPENICSARSIYRISNAFQMNAVAVHQEFVNLKVFYRSLANRNLDLNAFWGRVRQDGGFPLLMEMFDRIRVLPISSAAVERIFSAINLNITKIRNRLSTETMEGILHGKSLIRDQLIYEIDCEPMLKYCDESIYDFKDENYANRPKKKKLKLKNKLGVHQKKRKVKRQPKSKMKKV